MAANVRVTQLYVQVAHKDFGEVHVTQLYTQVAHKSHGVVQVTALYAQVASTGNLDPPSTARRIAMFL